MRFTDRCRHSFFPEKVEFFFSKFFCNQYESSIEVFLLLFYCYNGIPFRGWSLGSVWITDRCRHRFFFQFFFPVINMEVQLKYFYYCSIVIMVSRLGDWVLGSGRLVIDVDIVFFRKKLTFFFKIFL